MSALRAQTKAREVEERKQQDRRRAALVLILRHLCDNGYLNSIDALQAESGVSLKQMDAADNISLVGVLQEFEEFYEVKFGRRPKLIRKAEGEGQQDTTRKRGALQSMNGVAAKGAAGAVGKTVNSSARQTSKKDGGGRGVGNGNSNGGAADGGLDLGLDGTPITTEAEHSGATSRTAANVQIRSKDGSEGENSGMMPILKPIPDFGGSSEMRELASIITRDIYTESPNVSWDSIAGLESAKRLVKEAVIMPHRYPQLFRGILRPWRGILLYGPPGTGKTMLAKAIATECRTTFFNISASSVMSKWRGDSEKLVRVLFELARYHAPSTIFMDELDALMSQRGGDGGGVGEHEASRRLKTELLIQMDGLSSQDGTEADIDGGGSAGDKRVLFLGATNLPWELDSAMLRRLEKRIQIPLPTSEGRQRIFETLLDGHDGGPVAAGDVNFTAMALETEGFSGADVALVCKEAAMRPLRRLMERIELNSDASNDNAGVKLDPITVDDLRAALSTTKPTGLVHSALFEDFAERYGQVGGSAVR